MKRIERQSVCGRNERIKKKRGKKREEEKQI